jgi:hypothetical protein
LGLGLVEAFFSRFFFGDFAKREIPPKHI